MNKTGALCSAAHFIVIKYYPDGGASNLCTPPHCAALHAYISMKLHATTAKYLKNTSQRCEFSYLQDEYGAHEGKAHRASCAIAKQRVEPVPAECQYTITRL